MSNQFDRRHMLAIIAATGVAGIGAAALLPGSALAQTVAPIMGDVVLGDDAAPVTVIEYASFTCPHCAAFHTGTWPQFKAAYVDTGKVKFILREIYFDRFGLWASMTARCGGADAFYPMADQFLKKQSVWAKVAEDQIGGEIQKIGRLNGLSNDQLDACLADQDYAKALVEAYQKNSQADGVESTPTFIINGEKHAGNMPFAEFSALVDAHL
ncbi:MAG TPA: DsbA family protein [Thermohalobaculum sp.]|nr:DsbA family protein [Thermohalobaculum sp.]